MAINKIRYLDRIEAGHQLLDAIKPMADPQAVILALPRGGVPLGYVLAQALHAPLDVLLVRKLGVPGQEEVAMGAIASGGFHFVNEEYTKALQIEDSEIHLVIEREMQELERREILYRSGRTSIPLLNRQVIIVDDGIATGATMRVAVEAVRQRMAAEVIIAVPVAPAQVVHSLSGVVEHIVCPLTPPNFRAVSLWYENFPQTTDEEVLDLLQTSWRELRSSKRISQA